MSLSGSPYLELVVHTNFFWSKLGKLAARRVLDSRPWLAGTYATLSNIFVAEGIWGEFARAGKLMRGMGSKKETGRSWIEIGNQIFSLVARYKMVSMVDEILELLIRDTKKAGYVPYLDSKDRPSKRKKKKKTVRTEEKRQNSLRLTET